MAQIDSLEISIQSTVNEVNKSLDALIGKLGTVAKGISAIKNNKGLEAFAEEARNISQSMDDLGKKTAQSMKNIDTQVKKATKSVRQIVEEAHKSTMNLTPELNMGNLDAEARKYENQLRNMQNRLTKVLATPNAEKRSGTIENLIAGINEAENALKKIESIRADIPEINIKVNTGEAERSLSDFMNELDDFKTSMKSLEEVYGSLENIPVGGLDAEISNLKQGLEELKISFPEAKNEISAYENALKQLQEVSKNLTVTPKIEKIDTSSFDNAAKSVRDKIKELEQEFKDVGKDFYFEGNAEQLESEINKLNIDLEKLYEKRGKKIDLGEIDTKPFRDIMYQIQSITNKLEILESARPEALNKTLAENAERAKNAANQLKQFEANLQQLRVPPVNEENIEKLQKVLKKAEENLVKLQTKLANGLELGKITQDIDDSGYRNLREQIVLTEKTIEAYKEKINEVSASTKDASNAAESSTGYSRLTNVFIAVSNAAGKLSNALKKLIGHIRKFASSVANFVSSGMEKLSTGIKNAASGVAKLTKSLMGVIGANRKSNASFGVSLKTILKYGFGIRSLYVLFNKLRSAIKEGMNNLLQYSAEVNRSLSIMHSGLFSLKNALASAFAPIVNVIAPYVARFTNMMIDAANAIGRFFAALTGRTYAVQAKKVYLDLADAAKEAKKAVGTIGIDELNILSDQKDEELTPSDMFEWVKVEKEIADLAKKIRDAFLNQDWKGLGKAIAELVNKGLKKLYDTIKRITPKVEQALKNLAKVINSFIDNLDWDLLGRTIGAGINLLVKAFNALFGDEGIDLENLGRKLSVALRGMIDEVNWRELGNAIGNYLMIAWRIAYGFIEDMWRIDPNTLLTGWAELGNALGDIIVGIFERIDFQKISAVITEGFKGVLETLTYMLNTVSDNLDWIVDKINLGFNRLYDGIKWDSAAGENMAQKITAFADSISTAFNKLLDLDFGKVGQIIGAGITDIVRAFNQLTDISAGMDFEKLGTKLSDALRKFVTEIPWDEFGNALGNGFMIAWRTLDGFLTDMAKKSNAGLNGWQELGNAISGTINGLFEKFDLSKVADSIGRLINGMFSMLKQAVENMKWNEIADNISNGLNALIKGIQWKENGETFNKLMKNLLNMILRAVKNTDWKALGKGIGDFLDQIDWKGIFNKVFETIKETLGGLIDGLNETASGKIALGVGAMIAAFDGFSKILPAINSLFGDNGKIVTLFKSVFGDNGKIVSVVTALFGTKGKLIAIIGAGIVALGAILAVGGKDLVDACFSFINGLLDNLKEAIKKVDWAQVWHNIVSALGAVLSNLPEIVVKLAALAAELAGYLISGLIEYVVSGQGLKDLTEFALNLIQGIIKGVMSVIDALFDVVKAIFDAIYNGLKNLFGIHSPSTVMAEIGVNIMQGLINGIKSLIGGIADVFRGLVESIKTALQEKWGEVVDWWQNTALSKWWSESVMPWFTKDKWMELYDSIKTGLQEKWSELQAWWQNTGFSEWIENNVKPWFDLETWKNIYHSIKQALEEKWAELQEWWSNTNFSEWIDNYVKPFFDLETWKEIYHSVKQGLTDKWEELRKWWSKTTFKEWIDNHVKPWFEKDKWLEIYDSVKSGLSEKWESMVSWWNQSGAKQWIDSDVKPWFTLEKWKETYDAVKQGLVDKWEELRAWWQTTNFSEWIDNYVKPFFQKNTWLEIYDTVRSGLVEKWEELRTWWKNTDFSEWIDNHVKPYFTKEKWIEIYDAVKTGLQSKWEDMKSWWDNSAMKDFFDNHVKPWFSKDKWTWDGIKEGLKESFDNAIEGVKEIWNSFAEWLNDKLKFEIPEINIMGHQIFGGTTIDFGKIPTFAVGGFPEDGLFFANHNELVGQFSNGRTAVANNEQIIAGIEEAAYRGFLRAQADTSSYLQEIAQNTRETADKDMSVRIGDRDIVDSYRRGSERMGYVF